MFYFSQISGAICEVTKLGKGNNKTTNMSKMKNLFRFKKSTSDVSFINFLPQKSLPSREKSLVEGSSECSVSWLQK